MSERTRLRRLPQRAIESRSEIDAILDRGLVAHVGIAGADGEAPFVIPMVYARDGDRLLLHGSSASRLLRALAAGAPACATVTLLDGLVVARSAFHHSLNYRSVVVFGRGRALEEPGEKRRALDAIVEHVLPGRSREARAPNDLELRATTVVALAIDEVSGKRRTGMPVDDESDLALPIWAGLVPLALRAAEPLAADGVHVPPPPSVLASAQRVP